MVIRISLPKWISVVVFLLAGLARGEDFCFLQISDVHIEPKPAGEPPPNADEPSAGTIGWFCEQARERQTLEPSHLQTPKPSFVVCTGDLMEFGNVSRTFEAFENYFKPLTVPLYLVPGNHDNTWGGVMQIFREKYGGDHYTIDRFGCHFIFFDSATPQEPTPSLEQRTLTFLKNDLEKVGRETPVFMFCHHPLSTSEYAKPYEQLRFLETIRGYNVVCLFMGHGHHLAHDTWGTLDSVMGGCTFGDVSGYNIISVQGGILRVVYRYRDAKKEPKLQLEKPIKAVRAPALRNDRPIDHIGVGGTIAAAFSVEGGEPSEITANVDNNAHSKQKLARGNNGAMEGAVPLTGFLPGAHYLYATTRVGALTLETATPFEITSPGFDVQRTVLNAGMKVAALPIDSGLLLSTTAGDLIVIDSKSGSPRTLLNVGAEILHEPAWVDGTLFVGCGSGDVYSLGMDGKVNWKRHVGASAYGTPAVGAQRVYVADLQGFVHAIDRGTGKQVWSKRITAYPIEQSIRLHDGVLYLGAWDGLVYAIAASDGQLKWKARSPMGQARHSLVDRYYAAADASPIIVGDRLVVADRGYRLGSYTFDGVYMGQIAENIPGIGLSEDKHAFYARGYLGGLTKYERAAPEASATGSSDGASNHSAATAPAGTPVSPHAGFRKIWNNPSPLGRFPISPIEHAGKVYVCSNLGLLTAIDAATGKTLWQYQATAQLHVMAEVAVDGAGRACVVGMDGTVTSVSSRPTAVP